MMMKSSLPEVSADRAESEGERAARLARERLLLAEGLEDIHAGRFLTGAELDTWLDRFMQGLPPMHDDTEMGD